MKLEEGMYVRTYDGIIHKILDTEIEIKFRFDMGINHPFLNNSNSSNRIVKASHNITDLIEVGDYVNEELVEDITGEYLRINGQSHNKHYFSKHIKSIVTKEQFESISYKVN